MQAAAKHLRLQLLLTFIRILFPEQAETIIKRLCHHRNCPEGGWFKKEQMLCQLAHIPVQAQQDTIAHSHKYITVNTEYMMDWKYI